MEQGNVAKKLTGQILENWLLSFADGHGGIQTITKTTTSGLVDTYTITFSDTTTSTFTVTNGRSISNVTTSKSGKVTTVTISYNDGTSSSFTVRDGENVTGITEYWAVSTSGSSQPQSGWQTTPPTMTSTYKYLWHYSQYTYSDNTTTATTPAVQGVYGDKGDTGNTGTSITSVTKTGTSGLVDTYTITFSNGTTTTFQVTNGSEIESIEKTSTAGLVDTYTVTMGSGDTHTFTVTNGRSIVSFTQTSGTHAAGTIDVYTMTYNDGDTSQIQVYNGANGTGAVSTVAGIGVSSAEGDVPLIIKGYGDPTTATVGQVNQLYFDMTGGIMYICISTTGGSYDWRGMSSAVDSAMSTTSANPLQNRVISNKVGVGSLSTDFAATNLTDAANELQTKKANLASPTFTGTPKAPTAVAGTNNTQIATTAFVQDIASDLNGAITSLGSDDIANDSTNVSGLKVTNALDTLNGAITSLGSDDIANDSTNVSGLKVTNALDTLNGAINDVTAKADDAFNLEAGYATQIENGTDYNTILTPGNYYCLNTASCATMTNLPPFSTNGAHRLTVLELTPNRCLQIIIMNYINPSIWSRYHNGTEWQNWKKVDTYATMINIADAEAIATASRAYSVGEFVWVSETLYKVTANIAQNAAMIEGTNLEHTTIGAELTFLNDFASGLGGTRKYSFGHAGGETVSYTIPNTKYGIMLSLGTNTSLFEILLYRTTSAGVLNIARVFNATGLTITKSTNTLTIANTTSNTTQIVFLTLNTHAITVKT